MIDSSKELNIEDLIIIQDILDKHPAAINSCIRSEKIAKLSAIVGVLAIGAVAATSIINSFGVNISDSVYQVINYSGLASTAGILASASNIGNFEKHLKYIVRDALSLNKDENEDITILEDKTNSITNKTIDLIESGKIRQGYIIDDNNEYEHSANKKANKEILNDADKHNGIDEMQK